MKNNSNRYNKAGYSVLIILLALFMTYIVLIHPLMVPTKDMPFTNVFGTGKDAKMQYVLWTSGAIICAFIAMIPVIINDHKHEQTLSLMMKNRDNITHSDFMHLLSKLKYHVWLKGNSKDIQTELQALIDKYKGRDLLEEQYGIRSSHGKRTSS